MIPVDEYTFDSFVVGKSNEQAFTAASAVACGQNTIGNPLVICGGSGLGKTHLMYAIRNAITASHASRTVLMMSGEDLMLRMHEAVRSVAGKGDASEALKQGFQSVDYLLIDDIHVLVEKNGNANPFEHRIAICCKRRASGCNDRFC